MAIATLKKRSEFLRVAHIRNMARTQTIWVQCFSESAKNSPNTVRAGYTASKKTGNAICRNRGKRRMRHLVRDHLPIILKDFPNFSGDFVLIALPSTIDCAYNQLVTDFCDGVRSCLGRLKKSNF